MNTNTQQNVDMINPVGDFAFTQCDSPHQSSIGISSERHFWMSVVVWMSHWPLSWPLWFPRACSLMFNHIIWCTVNIPLSMFGRAPIPVFKSGWLVRQVFEKWNPGDIVCYTLFGHVSKADLWESGSPMLKLKKKSWVLPYFDFETVHSQVSNTVHDFTTLTN